MTLTIADAEDAYLSGTTDFEQWQREFEEMFYGPLRETMMAVMWDSMDEATKAQLQKMSPEAFEIMEDNYGIA